MFCLEAQDMGYLKQASATTAEWWECAMVGWVAPPVELQSIVTAQQGRKPPGSSRNHQP